MLYHGSSWFIIIFPVEILVSIWGYPPLSGASIWGSLTGARFLTNSSVDVWLAARDEQKTFDSQRSAGGGWHAVALVCLLRTLGRSIVAMRIR